MSTERSRRTDALEPQLDTQTKMLMLMDDMVVRLARMERIQESQVPVGKLESAKITVSPQELVLDSSTAPRYQLKGPWASITVTNDGGSDVGVAVNDGPTSAVVKPNESRLIDMKARGKVRIVKLTVTSATSIRFDGVV